ncbi:MAG: threonine synthase [Ferruginibacter sp.]|nr:threonine synthase [Cytophagales bacterium]
MQLYSTNRQSPPVSLEEALFRGLPPDQGLYLPDTLPVLPESFFRDMHLLPFREIAVRVAVALLGEAVPANVLREVVYRAIDFDAPVVPVGETYALELFHGPSMAFKDFGARFMAGLMAHFLQQSRREVHILVATSGDTGGAVAQGFYRAPGIRVTILYPSGKVSDIQEKQLTTLGGNVTALEVEGTFDDCQRLVKEAFLDPELNQTYTLSSANSINIARLIPQTFYYFYAYAQVRHLGKPLVFSVPSGNFGNLSAGVIARRMGLPVHRFIAATNRNRVVPHYLITGDYAPEPSVETISNAMDVGSPSNFARLQVLFGNQVDQFRTLLTGASYDDQQTRSAMRHVYQTTGYVMCPHTAVAYLGLRDYLATASQPVTGVFLATAHPAKFGPTVEAAIGAKVPLPERLAALLDQPKQSVPMSNRFDDFKAWLTAGHKS